MKFHYNLIKQALELYDFDKVYFVPVNDYYKKEDLARYEDRTNMIKLMIKSETKIDIYYMDNSRSFNTIDTLTTINDEFKNNEIVFFMGEDNFYKMPTWRAYDKLKKYNYIIFQRNDNFVANINMPNVIYMKNSENLLISSTLIRDKLIRNEDISNLVNKDVERYIKENKIYIGKN